MHLFCGALIFTWVVLSQCVLPPPQVTAFSLVVSHTYGLVFILWPAVACLLTSAFRCGCAECSPLVSSIFLYRLLVVFLFKSFVLSSKDIRSAVLSYRSDKREGEISVMRRNSNCQLVVFLYFPYSICSFVLRALYSVFCPALCCM